MHEAVLWLILLVAGLSAILTVAVLFRASTRAAEQALRDELRIGRDEARTAGKELREEVSAGLRSSSDVFSRALESLGKAQQTQLEAMTKQLKDLADSNQAALDRIRTTVDSRVKELADSNQGALERIRGTLDSRVKELQEGNEKKLDEMRRTVDEKLHETLEKRLGESFRLVSDRLEAVHKGLGEMQNLATGVGDLKRVLTNVKARGTWAEVQLGAILEQVLTPSQYEKNVRVKGESSETVEYAVRLPGPQSDRDAHVWLPIDSKFPQEDYLRVQEAAETGDPETVQKATDALARTVRTAAKDVHDKYVDPPNTTDFAIIFLATEGLYAEVLRQPALVDDLLHRYRVVVAGPTTLAAILSSLRMGFQTLAVEQRAAEVWRVLGAVKTEFGKFGDVLDKVRRQLTTASRTIEETGVRTRAMERRLRSVEQLPEDEAARLLELPVPGEEPETE
jgi:DNA recombination protein RmuC